MYTYLYRYFIYTYGTFSFVCCREDPPTGRPMAQRSNLPGQFPSWAWRSHCGPALKPTLVATWLFQGHQIPDIKSSPGHGPTFIKDIICDAILVKSMKKLMFAALGFTPLYRNWNSSWKLVKSVGEMKAPLMNPAYLHEDLHSKGHTYKSIVFYYNMSAIFIHIFTMVLRRA